MFDDSETIIDELEVFLLEGETEVETDETHIIDEQQRILEVDDDELTSVFDEIDCIIELQLLDDELEHITLKLQRIDIDDERLRITDIGGLHKHLEMRFELGLVRMLVVDEIDIVLTDDEDDGIDELVLMLGVRILGVQTSWLLDEVDLYLNEGLL